MISCLLFTNRTLEVLVVSIHVYLLLPIFMLLFYLFLCYFTYMLFYLRHAVGKLTSGAVAVAVAVYGI